MRGRIVPIRELPPASRDAMYRLLTRHFAGVTEEGFGGDLAEKDYALLAEDDRGLLHGFSTLLVHQTSFRGEPVGVVCSGDTIVDTEARRTNLLAQTWLAAVITIATPLLQGRLWWLLICSGFRTYRFLPVFWREFHPRFDHAAAPQTRALLDHLAWERWGDLYLPKCGLVRFPRPQLLRRTGPAAADVRGDDPHVAYFRQRNPGHSRGDELVCLTELTPANLTHAGRRILRAVVGERGIESGPWIEGGGP